MEVDSKYCPIIKLECKKEECILWFNMDCLVQNFFLFGSSLLLHMFPNTHEIGEEQDGENVTNQKSEDVGSVRQITKEENLLQDIFSKTPDELSEEIIRLADEDNLLDGDVESLPYGFEETFWLYKGLTLHDKDLPVEYLPIKKRAWIIAEHKIHARYKIKQRLAIENENVSDSDNDEQLDTRTFEQNQERLPHEVMMKTNEELGKELLEFAKNMDSNGKHEDLFNLVNVDLFWKTKGIRSSYLVDVDSQVKIKHVENSARLQFANEIFSSGIEQLSKELVDYVKNKSVLDPSGRNYVSQYAYDYWKKKGIGRMMELFDVNEKKHEIERQAQQIIDNEVEEKLKILIEKEKTELPIIIDTFAKWARNLERKAVTMKDLDYFLLMNNIEVTDTTKRALYLGTNAELRTRKPSTGYQDNLL